MTVYVNGDAKEVPPGTTLAGLIEVLGLSSKRMAVERNRSIVAPDAYAETALVDSDRLEIISFVGGG
ncbi:MAG: sulfur carrier protein ThiS [bacterium]|nr:sulfur carrier protein ThiS [bacterium]